MYFDSASTTPIDPEVVAEMTDALRSLLGNPSATAHGYGQAAARRVASCRELIADAFSCEPDEVIFTSGATESDNLALIGIARAYAERGRHLVISAIEHRAVLACAEQLEREGFEITRVRPDVNGVIQPEAIAAALRPDTLLVSVMHTNNEIGVLQPIEAIAEVAAEAGVLFHVDAAQAAGKYAIDLDATPIDLLTASAHKLHGPKGIGCLIIRNRRQLRLTPLMFGGEQEHGLRPGTLPVHQIIGFASALAKTSRRRDADRAQVTAVRDRFLHTLTAAGIPVIVHGAEAPRSPYILGLSIPGIPSDALINQLAGSLALSSGSACSSGTVEPSHVLRAMGVNDRALYSAFRVSFDRTHRVEQAEEAAHLIIEAVRRIQDLMR
ncbi:cysteine desulfurase family protein [Halochromatium salexigens]|nr:cysteine desulfurase family protein [Halochromatium salexigens]